MAGEPDDAASQPQKTTTYMLRGALIVSLAILLLFGLMGSLLIFRPVKLEGETLQIVTLIMGTLVSMVSVVGQYWLGSSAGSTLKNATMMQQAMLPTQVIVKPEPPQPTSPAPPTGPTNPPTAPQPKPNPLAGAMPWVTWALHEVGQKEEPDNRGPVVQRYIDLSHCGSIGDPWCAIFANAALEAPTFQDGSPKLVVRGTRSPSSQSFRNDPNFIPITKPARGALAVFWRGSKGSGLGHVGFYWGESADGSKIWTLGGNENDMVQIEALPRDSKSFGFIGYWWPKEVPAPADAAPIIMPEGSPISIQTSPLEVPSHGGTTVKKFMNITATMFGGPSDPEKSAYTGEVIDDKIIGCSLPFRFSGTPPMVTAENSKDPSKTCTMKVVDVGPWNTKDPYWQTGSRPQAETGTDLTGRKTNGAGIDLTVAAASILGIDGKGLVNWWFVSDQGELQFKVD